MEPPLLPVGLGELAGPVLRSQLLLLGLEPNLQEADTLRLVLVELRVNDAGASGKILNLPGLERFPACSTDG